MRDTRAQLMQYPLRFPSEKNQTEKRDLLAPDLVAEKVEENEDEESKRSEESESDNESSE